MYSGQIVLSEVPDFTKITRFLDFLILADRIDLLGPLDTVLHQVKMALRASYLVLQPAHVRKAIRFLPSGHALRKLFAESCAQAYLSHTQPAGENRFREWHFENEVDNVEGFASDLLKAIGDTGRSRRIVTGGIVVRDAVTNKTFSYY